MRKKALYVLLVVAFIMSFSTICFAAEVTVGGDLEIVYSQTSTDAGGGSDVDSAAYTTTDADIDVKVKIDENTEAAFKVDADDNASQLEEIYVIFKGVGPVDLKVGKQEVAFGQDKDLGIADPLVHQAEVDEKFGVTISATPIPDSPKIELTLFQDRTGQGSNSEADKPADNGITQSLAARLTSTRVAGLTAEVSYIVRNWEGEGETYARTDDESAWSIGLDYTMDPVNIFVEYVMANDIDHDTDINGTLLSLGVDFKAAENINIVAQYHHATEEDNFSAGTTPEPTYDAIQLTPKYTMGNGVELALEYLSETWDADMPGVSDVDADTISARVKYSF